MPAAAIVWGCIAAVVSSAVQSLGITLQRKSHVIAYRDPLEDPRDPRREPAGDTDYARHAYKRNMWLVGFFLFIVANVVGSVVQLSTLPLIVLSPLQSIGLIFNSVFSCLLLPGEHSSAKLAGGTVVIALGAFIIAYLGGSTSTKSPAGSTDERLRETLRRFARPGFLSWWLFTFAFMAVLFRIIWTLSGRIRSMLRQSCGHGRRSLRSGRNRVSRLIFARGVLYGVVSGTLTAHTFLFAKSLVDLLVDAVWHKSAPKNLRAFVFNVFLVVFTLTIVALQVAAFNKGLSNILTSILYPLCFLVYNTVNLVNDVLFNALFSTGAMTAGRLLWVIFGLVNVMFGVVLISRDSAFSARADEAPPLMAAKFPYDPMCKDGAMKYLSYEEEELLGQFGSGRADAGRDSSDGVFSFDDCS